MSEHTLSVSERIDTFIESALKTASVDSIDAENLFQTFYRYHNANRISAILATIVLCRAAVIFKTLTTFDLVRIYCHFSQEFTDDLLKVVRQYLTEGVISNNLSMTICDSRFVMLTNNSAFMDLLTSKSMHEMPKAVHSYHTFNIPQYLSWHYGLQLPNLPLSALEE